MLSRHRTEGLWARGSGYQPPVENPGKCLRVLQYLARCIWRNMNTIKNDVEAGEPDPAAVFAAAMSLWKELEDVGKKDPQFNLSDAYSGVDEAMRQTMRVANLFEQWACSHIAFEEMSDVWPYALESKFGAAVLNHLRPGALREFDEMDCLRVAIALQFPVKIDDKLPVPIDISASNPISGSHYKEFRIQTVRSLIEEEGIVPFTVVDEPFDGEFGPPYFGIYGIGEEGLLEHIADRSTYAGAAELLRKLAPGIDLPDSPTSNWGQEVLA
jgi:hypothetical protein